MTLYQYSGSQGSQSLPFFSFESVQNFSLTYTSFDNINVTFDSSIPKLVSPIKRTFDYNLASISDNNLSDYGSITNNVVSLDDYEQISQLSSTTLDYGLITQTVISTIYPFGGMQLIGSADTEWINKNFYGSAFGTIGQVTVTYSPDDTTGTLFSFGEKIERRSYDYNQSSIENTEGDYGLINQVTLQTEDYQSITTIHGLVEEFGFISEPTGGLVFPFGTITLSGSAITSANYRLFFYGSSVEKFVYSPDDTTGTLFSFGEKIERIAYSYNEQSIFNNIDDYGLVSELTIGGSDYGSITSISGSQPPENYGSILESVVSSVSIPFGSLSLSGIALESKTDPYIGDTATIFISGNVSDIQEIDSYEGSGIISLSGTSLDSSISDYIGFGTLFGFGEKIEKVTYDYNETSIVPYDILNYGLITSPLSEYSDDYESVNSLQYRLDDYGFIVGFGATESLYPFGSIFISGSVSNIKETDSYNGFGTIFLSDQGSIVEIESYDGSGSVFISGTALESDIDSYIGVGTLTISNFALESEIETYNGFGLITLSGTSVDKFTGDTPDNTQLFTISGTAVEKDIDSYVGVGTLFISGELVHPNIDYTPHYGIEKNIGIGTTGIQLSGSAADAYSAQTPEDTQLFSISGTALEAYSAQTPEDTQLFVISGSLVESETDSYEGSGSISLSGSLVESETDSYQGSGTISLSGTALQAYSAQTPEDTQLFSISGTALESETDLYIGDTVTISIFTSDVTRYYSPIYPRNALIGDPGSGIGTIRFDQTNDIAKYGPLTPWTGSGTVLLYNGANESFSRTNYNGSGFTTISGISSNREIAVYGYYGDDNNPGTSGSIFISEQTASSIVLKTNSHLGLGTITLNDSSARRRSSTWSGSGEITLSGIGLDSITIVESNTTLFEFNGSKFESFTPATEIGSGIITITGSSDTPIRTFAHEGSGSIVLNGNAIVKSVLNKTGRGTIRFVPTFRVDDDYISCDSDTENILPLVNQPVLNNTSITFDNSNVTFDNQTFRSNSSVTCDRQDNGIVKFVANPPENTILFTINGSSITSVISLDSYVGIGNIFISGGYTDIRSIKSEVGTGAVTISQSSKNVEINSYVGLGSILNLSGSSESKVVNLPENTILVQIGGTASTRVEIEYSYVGVGTQYFNGIGSQRIVYADRGIGLISLSGNLVYPDIKFVPSPDGSGTISIVGISQNKLAVVSDIQGGSFFTFYGGFESFSKTNYTGIGTMLIVGEASPVINNPFQPSRVYVTII